MPKRSRKVQNKSAKRRVSRKKARPQRDENQSAFDALQHVITQTEGTGKDPLAVALGRRGGLKGGKARAAKMSVEERSKSASDAAKARWGWRTN